MAALVSSTEEIPMTSTLARLTARVIVAAKASPAQAARLAAATKASAKSFAEQVKEEEARIKASKA
jgi:hypothetical protein